MAKSSTSFKDGNKVGGRRAKTAADYETEDILHAGAPDAARKLVEIIRTGSDSDSLKAAQALLKITHGDTVRAPVDADGKTVGAVDAESVAKRVRELAAGRSLVVVDSKGRTQ